MLRVVAGDGDFIRRSRNIYMQKIKNSMNMELVSEAVITLVDPRVDYYSHNTDRKHIERIMFETHGISGILDKCRIDSEHDRLPGDATPGRQTTPDHRKIKKKQSTHT